MMIGAGRLRKTSQHNQNLFTYLSDYEQSEN
jgi:hypothetical protein